MQTSTEMGFIEYHAKASGGLSVKSWKDSWDSMIYVDGELARSPMAVCEVQGYMYAAKKQMSAIFRELSRADDATRLEREADELKSRFNQAFWMPDSDFYAIA